ncbi:MAG: type II secretion system major pseudopilin GspG [bacterium]
MRTRNPRSAFTLIEIMIVVIILAALAAMVVPYLGDVPDTAKSRIAKVEIKSIGTALQLYKLETGGFPKDLAALQSVPQGVAGRTTKYLMNDPIDPWGAQYKYKYPGTRQNTPGYDLYSTGPNKFDDNGATDDITNWKQD